MNIGINPLAIGARPPKFLPWKDARAIEVWDASAPYSLSGSNVISAPGLKNPANALVVPSLNTGPTVVTAGAGIASHKAFRFDGALQSLNCPGIVLPAFGAGAVQFWVMVGRALASASGNNVMLSAGSGASPNTSLGFSGAGIQGQSAATTLNVTTGYAQGTAKRWVQRLGATTSDYVQWGSAGTPVTGTFGAQSALTGFTLACRGDLLATTGVTHAQCDIAWVGLFTGDPATGGLLAKIDAWLLTQFAGLAT